MKRFTAFVKKEFFHIFRDVRTVMILLLMPVAQILLFGFALSSEVKNVDVAILDNSRSEISRQITDQFSNSKYFRIAKNINSREELDKVFSDGKIGLVIIYGSNFEKDIFRSGSTDIAFMIDSSDPNKGSTINLYAMNIIASVNREISKRLPHGNGQNFQGFITPEVKMLYNPQGKSVYNFVPGVMGMIIMLICAMMTSISIVREKENNSMEMLLTSPVKPMMIIFAKVIPYFLISFISLCCILIISVFILDMEIKGNIATLIGFSMLYIMLSLSIGILISSVMKTQVSAMLISGMGLLMPIMMLSGMLFPIDSMPEILQTIANIIPAKWFIIGVKRVMIEGLGITAIINEIIILSLMIFFVLLLSFKKFKNRLE